MSTVIKNGTVVTASDIFKADVKIDQGKVSAIGNGLAEKGDKVIDARGKYLLPGGIDVHTHLDMPFGGTVSSDDFYTGHVAAAFGGTTTHLDFCIQQKGTSLKDSLKIWHGKADGKAVIDYGFHVAITDLNDKVLKEISTLPGQGVSSIKVFLAYKGALQIDDTTMFKCLQQARDAGVLTMVHAENGDAIDILVKEAVAKGNLAPKFHALTRPPQLEGEATGRAIAMAEVLGAPLYVVHLTCNDALVRVREARSRGSRIYAETCTQYFFFTKDDLARKGKTKGLEAFEGAKWVCSPPFRTEKDQEALWQGVRDDDLSVVSTDHCPFNFKKQKTLGLKNFAAIPNGCPGIEDRMMVLHQAGVRGGRFDLQRFVALTATNPAKLFGLDGVKGSIAVGYDADIAVWDMNRKHTISAAKSHSAIDYNLYEGMKVQGVPVTVMVRGETVVDNGKLVAKKGSGQFLRRSKI